MTAIMSNMNITEGITADAKSNMIANLNIEIEARIEKLRAQCEAQCSSMRSRLERRVNRVPMATRQTALVDLLKASAPTQPIVAPAPAAKATTATTSTKTTTTTTKKAAGNTTSTAARKTRTVAPSNASASSRPTSSHTSSQEERVKTTKITKPTPAYAKPTKTARAKKRNSDELSGEDKENSELPVPKKRTRNDAQKPAAEKPEKTEKGAKTATVGSTRSTRAGSRTKPDAAHVLSPKTNAANARKPAARNVRPR